MYVEFADYKCGGLRIGQCKVAVGSLWDMLVADDWSDGGTSASALRISSMTPIAETTVAELDAINGRIQVSGRPGDTKIGLLVERDELFGGVLLSPSQARKLACLLLNRSRLDEVAASDADHKAALARIDALMDAEAGTPRAEELAVLADLVEAHEAKHFPIKLPSPVEAIRFRMEQAGLGPRDLEPYIGSRGKVSDVLSGKQSLTLPMIRALHQHLGIPAEVLVQDSRGEGADR